MISITINGEVRELPGEICLDRVLELFSFPSRRVAVELNREVVRRIAWGTTLIRENDRIEIVHFVGGG